MAKKTHTSFGEPVPSDGVRPHWEPSSGFFPCNFQNTQSLCSKAAQSPMHDLKHWKKERIPESAPTSDYFHMHVHSMQPKSLAVQCQLQDLILSTLETLIITSGCFAGGAPTDVRIAGIVNDSDSSTVTIEWTPPTPPPTRGYSVITTPTPLSPTIVNTISTSIDITVNYNTHYSVTVGSVTCDGLRTRSHTFSIGTYNNVYASVCRF